MEEQCGQKPQNYSNFSHHQPMCQGIIKRKSQFFLLSHGCHHTGCRSLHESPADAGAITNDKHVTNLGRQETDRHDMLSQFHPLNY